KFYVRAICSPTDKSDVSDPATANTQLVPPACGGTFTDPGGANANYANSIDSTTTICPTIPGQQVTVTFTSFNTEATWDGLYIFDGNSIASPQLASTNPAGNVPGGLAGSYWGTAIPGPFTSSSADGCLTFRFRSDASVNNPGWVANVTCLPPPTCAKPNLLTATNLTLTGATLSWTQLPNPDTTTATTWEVYIVPAGSVPPTATSTGIITSTNPYVATGLNAATCYDYYVRAVCSSTDSSLWAGPKSFCTLIPNDECNTATVVPVNSDTSCAQVVAGTVIGATASTQANICGGTADDDVWFQFTATTTSHYVSLNNVAGSSTFMYTAIYSGTCNNLTQIACSNGNNSTTITGLTVGQTYLIRVYTSTATPNQNTTFNVCVGTIPPPITTNDTQYTTQQLVENVLFNSSCATVTNITTSTGTNFGSVNGIGYFNKNGSSFPFNDGVILTSGSITNAPGPNTSTSSDGTSAWTGDTDLEAIILAATGNPMNSHNASKLEFDFVPLVDNISFDFIFASEEYGTFQCSYSDAFAFILTDLTAGGTPTNLAVVPGTTPPTPISVVTVRDNTFNTGCASLNAQYFGDYHLLPLGLDPLGAPTNFNGDTVPLTAQSAVIPGHQYHIKLVVADRSDNILDSAVFLKGGSFNFGLELGLDFLITNGTALCYGNQNILTSGLNPAQYTFVWSENGVVIPGQTGPNLTIDHSGTYSLVAQLNGTTCSATDSKTVEYYLPINIATPSNLSICNASGYGQFNLSSHNPIVTTGLQQPATYTVSYYLTNADAIAGTNQLPNLYTNTTQFLQTIYVRAQNGNGCFGTAPVQLVVQDLTPTFTMTPNFSICAGSTGTISVTATNYDPAQATYSWTLNGNPFAATTSSISVTQAGTYVVTVNNFGCTATGSTQVTVNPYPIIAQPANQTNCNSYTLPALTVGNYFTGTGGTGTPLSVGDVITTSQIIYIYAVNGNGCSSEKSFSVSIVPIASPTVAILTQPTCAVQTGSIEVTSPIGTTSSLATDLFISEVTDAETGSLTYVELYNGTGVTKDLSNYKLKIYNNGSTTASCDLILSGTILNGTTNVIKVSSDANQVSVTPNQSFPGCGGVNTNDNIRLTTSANVPIDNWGRTDGVDFTPMNMPGYTYRRLQAAPHPSLAWNPNDWTALDPEDYSDVGSYSFPSPSTYSYSLDGGTYTTNPIFTGLIPGSHTVTVQNVGTGCVSLPTTVTINAVPFTTAVTTFSYATPVCKIATTNPTPNTTASGFTFGGIYSTLNTGITLNPTTGEINLANTLAGTYTITYTASNLSLCQNVSSSNATIVITAPTTPVTTISYTTPVCKIATTNPGPNPSPPGFIPNGTYNSTAGLSINSSTGVIDLATSTAGQYVITYSVGSNPSICQDSGSSTFTIQIDAPTPSVTTFTYATPFCKTSTTNPGPDQSPPGFVTGGTYSSTAGLSINSLTGVIDLATSTVGQYVITYSVNDNPSTCQSANSSTFTVQINAPAAPVTSFSYDTPFCSVSPNASPMFSLGFTTGGQYASTNGLVINTSSGVVDINASNPGSYLVTYTVGPNNNACLTGGTFSAPIVIKNDITGQVSQGCQGPSYILTVSPLNNSYDPASATYSWSDGTSSLGSQESQTVTNPGNYTVTITSAGCTGNVVVLVDAFGCSIPKGISPNGDQKNDFFDLTGLNVKQLGIFNRYGIKVYSKTDYTKEWFGQSNADEELPDGTYYYVIERENQETRTGWVYINRENK
ncbi:MAG: choice-of-anchor L domain-containing protein, partial [Flavobacterium sp.]|nr:choice-of-anchor L domain-containing protein [Flavobacterium sp.]